MISFAGTKATEVPGSRASRLYASIPTAAAAAVSREVRLTSALGSGRIRNLFTISHAIRIAFDWRLTDTERILYSVLLYLVSDKRTIYICSSNCSAGLLHR